MTRWNNWTRLQPVQFEWEDEPQPRVVRLVSESARVDDPVRVTVAGVEVEGASRLSSPRRCVCALTAVCSLAASSFVRVVD